MKKTMAMILACLTTAACSANEPTGTASAPISEGLEGTYDFVLEASDVAPKIREECAGDAACWNAIATQAAKEKIRFTRTANGIRYTSFEIEGGKETVHFEMPADLTRVVRRPDGTIAIKDDKKGMLVFRRAS